MMTASKINYEPVRDIFAAMRSEQIEGYPLSDVIGGGDAEFVAAEVVALISNYADLTSPRSILDVGCGCGRIATALTQHVSEEARYVGVDIIPGLIEFARKFISPRYPQFEFLILDDGNVTYNAWRAKPGEADLMKLAEAKPAGSVDLAISLSLFTHLDYEPARETLTTLHDLLAPGARAFVTIFVLDAAAMEAIEHGRTGFSFKHRTPGGRLQAEKLEDPTYAVAYDERAVDELIGSTDFILERWVRGYWSHGVPGETFQDALVLRKE